MFFFFFSLLRSTSFLALLSLVDREVDHTDMDGQATIDLDLHMGFSIGTGTGIGYGILEFTGG